MPPKGIITLIFGIVAIVIWMVWPSEEPGATALKLSIGWLGVGCIEFCTYLYENRKRLFILQAQWFKRNKPIRVTAAYLFRIEWNGQYLLIKRHKKDNPGYQPVGGTYKYFKEENRELFDKLGIEPCNRVERDDDTEHDLRIIIRKRKKLIEFLKWFESRKDRELDPWREFAEEMIEQGHVTEEAFQHIKYVFVRKAEEYVSPSPVYDVDEFRYADIFELRLEGDQQRSEIKALLHNGEEIIFATADEIRAGMTTTGQKILPHTFKILPKC